MQRIADYCRRLESFFDASAIFFAFCYILLFKKAFVKNLSEQLRFQSIWYAQNTGFKIVGSLSDYFGKCDLAIENANSLSLKQCTSIAHFPKVATRLSIQSFNGFLRIIWTEILVVSCFWQMKSLLEKQDIKKLKRWSPYKKKIPDYGSNLKSAVRA